MDENTNQPSTTPLGNERSQTPGQDNIITDMPSKAPSWDENTPLSDITKQYTDIGTAFTQIAENAADNVGDRQVQLVGNDFGATNPYMFNTYYEPSATSFASEMRQQGTQKALEEGLDRGEKEAQKRLSAARQRYSNAIAAAKQREEQRRQAKAHVSETDTSKMPEGVTEEEFQNYLKVTEGMSDKEKREYQRSLGIKEIQDEYKGSPINWDIKSKRKVATSATKKKFGITDEQWAKMSQKQKDEFWGRRDVGNYWTEQYMLNYFKKGSTAGEMMAENFQRMNDRADKVVDAINKNDFSDLKNYNTDLASIDVSGPDLATKFDNLRKTIEANEKYTPEQKSKYTEAINEYENAIRQVQYSTKQAKEIMNRGGSQSTNRENAEIQLKTSVNNLVAAKNKAKEAFSDMSADEYGTLFADADSVTAKFSGLDDHKIDNNGADGYTSIRKKNELLSPYGLSFGDWQKLSQLKAEKPDDFNYLRDHTNFVLAGGGGAFEQITDGNKKYFINGKYWSANDEDSPISVGDIIFHSIDGTIDEEGEYRDKDLKNFVKIYTDIYNGKRDYDDAAKKELTASYNQYAKRLSAAFYLGRRNGISLNENIYNVLLAQDGAGSETDLTITNPADPNTKISLAAAAKWFMSADADKQAVAYAEIAKRARQSAGYIMMHDPETDQFYNAPLVQNGEDTIGQKGKMEYKSSNPGANTELAQQVANLSDEDCLALNIYLDNKIKDGTIDKGFLAYDGVPLGDVMVNSAVGAFGGFFQFMGWAGQTIAAFATGYDEKNEHAIEAGKIWDSMSTIDANDDHNGDKDNVFNNRYTEAVREQQADNLNHMVDTTFNIDYFDPSNEIDAKTGQVKNKKGEVQELTTNNYFDQYGWKYALNVGAGMVGNIAEFAAESALTAGVGKIVGTALKGIGKAIKATDAGSKFINGASRFLTANATPTGIKLAINDIKASNTIQNIVKKVGSEEAVKSVLNGTKRGLQSALDDVARKSADVAKEVATKADDAARIGEKAAEVAEKVSSTADNVAENIATKADDVVEGLADNVAEKAATKADDVVEGAETAVEGAETAAKSEVDNVAESTTQKLSKREITDLNKQLKEAKKTLQENAAIRYSLDATVDNVDDVAESFGKRLADKLINKWNDTNISKKLVASVRSNIDDGLAQAVQRAAINTRLASAAGISAERIAALPDTTAEILYGVLRASEENSDKLIDAIYVSSTMRRTTAAGRDIILGNIDFKKVAENIVEMSERAGTKYTLGIDDIFRSMATDMSTTPGKLMNSLRFSDFMKNRIADWSRDILQNYWTPELDKNFQSYYITPEQYFTDPTQWGMGLLFDAGTSMLKRGSSRLQLNWTNHKINEIMGKVDFTTANAADAAKMKKNLIKLDNLRNDAMKLNNKILDGKVSYKKIHEVAENAENAIQQHISHLTGDLDMVKSAELVTSQSAQAMEEAQTALAKGTRKGRREYHKILADADQINRIIIRGNDKLMAFQEVNASLQQVSITRYLDIDAHSKTICKMTGKQWGAAVSDAFDELKDVDFAKVYGEADAKSFTGYTINVKDKEKAKAAYRVGQDLVYDTIYNKMTAIMGGSLTVLERRELKAELNMLKERMITSGENIIDDGGKVRWNYFPTQALTWEAEPGSSSAVRALWGWDYKGGMHTGIAGEIANPELARDQWDIFKINQDYRNGQETFKRRRGDADKAREEGKTGKVNVEQFRDVQYNWEGYNPAYAVNAYLNSLDSAKYVSPLLDPINGIVVKNPEAALAVSKMSIRQMRAQESAINTKYDTMIAKKLEQKKTAKANRTSKKSLERRAKLVEDFSGSTKKVLSSDAQAKVSSIEANEVKVRRDTQKKIHDSPLVSTLADLYVRRGDVTGVEANRFAVNKLNDSFNQLGNDIKAVRDMYRKDGKLKKKYLGKDGKVLPKYLDVEGNIVPEKMTGTFAMDSATQYRRFVNQLANNKSLSTDIFDPDNHRIIKFDDGSQINAMAFQKELYDVLCTKQILDLGYSESEGRKALALRKSMSGDSNFDPELVISKRLQPVEVDDVEARRTLTKGATGMLEQIYGTKNKFTGSYDLDPQMDTLVQDAIAKAWDDVEAHGGEINIYDFTREVDKHLPDFVKVGNKASTKELNDVMRLLRRYESAGGTNAELLADLRNAIDTETDPAKKATLTTAYNTVKQLDDYNNRTTNRAGLDNSLDETLDGGDDASSDEVLTRGDITADENLSGQQEGLANTYVPKGVDENLIGSAGDDSVAEQSDVSLSDWMFTELNRHYSKPKYDNKTVSAIADKYLDKVTKAQTPDEITKVADEIASDLVPLDPEVKGSATELKHVTTDIKNAIHWLKETTPNAAPQKVEVAATPNKPVTPAGQVSALAKSLDIINANKGSNWAQRREYRNNRRQKFDALENQFNVISDILESKIVGKNIRTAYDILPANQVLTPETISKKFSDGNVTISKASAKKFDNYQKAYENASKKKTDAAKKRLIDSYKTLAESVNTDQAKAAQKARVEGGTGIYRGTHLLEGAKDRQVLALASGQREVRWDPDYGQSVTYKSDGTVKSTYDKSVSHANVKNMLTAGTDGFGNIVFMDPKNIDEFIKKNNLKISDDLKKRIDAYKAAYAADSDYITAADHRYRVADSTVSMNDSFPEYLSSMNDVDANGNPTVHSLAEGGTGINDYRPESARYEAKNTFDDIEKAYKKAESDFYAANPDAPDFEEKMNIYNDALQKYNEAKKRDTREFTNKRVQKEIENAKGELDSVAYTADRGYGAQMQDTLILEPDDLYDFGDVDKATREVSAEIDRVSKDNPAVDTRKIRKANEEFDNVRKETEPKIKELGQKLSAASTEEMKSISKQIDDLRSQFRKEVDSIERDWYKNHRSEDSYWVTERVYELRDKFDKKEADLRKKLESVAPDEYKKLSEELNAEYDKINTARAKLVKELDSVNSKTDNKKLSELGDRFKSIDREKESIGRSSTSTDIEDYTEANDNPAYTPTYATPYADYLNATDHVNVSEESNKLNTLFYGNGDNTGFFDSMDKLAGEKNEAMGGIAIDFDESISDKLTELKKLDGAKDGEVITILEAAKQQADGIENKTVRDYINKRLDEEIDFAKKNLELKPGTSAKVRADFLNHDPEYKALKTRQKGMLAERGSKNAMYTPSGSHPVFIDGNVTPDGHYTLQQLLDARREVDLSRKKNGKNGFKSSKETRDILNSMRKDFNDGYDGSSLISSGAARQNDAWMLNLYSRVHESAGLEKLPKTPSFAEIEAGKMTATVDGKEVEIALPLKMSDIYIDPQVAALGAHYWGEGKSTKVEMVYKAATALSNFSKAVQDIQLAGGVGQFNALTLRNAITMMWQDPIGGTRALFSNFHNARSNDSVVKFYLDNHEKLLKMAIDSGDFSTINGFVNVVNMRDEIGGRGMIQEFSKQVGEIPNVFKDKGLHHGFWGNASNLYEAIFQNPTFVRWMAVAKADMQIRNYDKATRFVNRIQAKYNLTDDDFRYVEGGMGSKDKYIATLAKLRTDRYWTPSEFAMSKGRAQTYLQRQSQDIMKRTSESLRGMPQKKTIRQCLSDFFFAIGYKLQMNAHPVSGIATIFTALPNSIRAGNQVANRRSFNLMSSRFSGRGNRNQALVMIGIAALAHIYNTYNGFPSAWEELWSDHGDPNNGTAGLPQTLMNFQDLGKFHIRKGNNPNDYYTADPFFSVFTLQNSAMRAANKAIFPNQIPYNTQRTFAQEDNQNLISRIQGVSDELIGANLLSGYKAIYEVLNNNTYFGNNIWEQPKLPNGENNPNYNPLRNMIASVAHILNTEEWWFGTASNRWVKGLDIDAETWKDGKQVDPYTKGIFGKIGERGKYNGKTGTVAGSGIFQHEYVTALKHINDGEYFEALTESMELPFKSRNYEAKARTQLNTDVMMALRNARKEYDEKVKNASPDEKNQAYAAFAKKAVDIVHDWSAKNEYALGKNGELDATATKMLVSFMADEYDDVTNRIMNRYDKLRQDLKMADGDEFLFSTDAMNAAIADGMDDDVAAEKHNAHLKALQEAYIKEYDARQALIKAGIDPDQFDTPDYIHDDLSAVDATFDKKTFKELTAAFNKPIGEFSNYEEMKNYYEELIANASTTKQKAKLANQYNKYVTDVIAPYVGKGFAAQAFNDIYWDSKNLSNELGKYVIIPADKYYTGKSPRASYLKDLLGIGYRNNENLPSDKDIVENIAKVNQALAKGQTSSAASLVDNALLQLRKGTLHASPEDRQKLIRMRALLSSRRK